MFILIYHFLLSIKTILKNKHYLIQMNKIINNN